MQFLRLSVVFLALVYAGAPFPLYAASGESHYVSTAELSPQFLPPPPAENSSGWKKNIQGVLAAQRHIGAGDLAAMRDEQRVRLSLMTDVIGPGFTREKFPRTFLLLDRVFEDSENIAHADKQFWHTRRPYLTDKRVKLLVDRIDQSPAYPSGHACFSRVVAEVLGMLYPERLADLRARADAIAYHRIEAGVHYPGDIEGGRLLAMLIIGAMAKSDEFQSDLEAARDEIRR
jgi:acid phosphatase (class A)